MKSLILVFFLMLPLGCNERDSVYSSLALIHAGLDYPHTLHKLVKCQEIGDEPCLKAYHRVRAAKRQLLSRPEEDALARTLHTIENECSTNGNELDCIGAITALYFFPSSSSDAKIRGFLDSASSPVLLNIVSKSGNWLSNRNDKSAWRSWMVKSRLSAEQRNALLIYLDKEPEADRTINHLDDSELENTGNL